MAVLALLLGAGCKTQYRPMVESTPSDSIPGVIEELGAVSAVVRKTSMFHQPRLTRQEVERLRKTMLLQAPGAEFLSSQTLHATLNICPTARLPVLYRLRVEVTGTAARTNIPPQ